MLPAAPLGLPILAVRSLVEQACGPGVVVEVVDVDAEVVVATDVEALTPVIGAEAAVVVGATVVGAVVLDAAEL